MKTINHFIDGKEAPSKTGQLGAVYDPATGTQQAQVVFADSAEVDAAVASAKAAFETWGQTSLSRRSEIMFKFRELLEANKQELARVLTSEHGKVNADALGEISRALENVEFACGIPQLLKGNYSEQASTGVDVYSVYEPLGVIAGITPFNFPAIVPIWMFANAIAS